MAGAQNKSTHARGPAPDPVSFTPNLSKALPPNTKTAWRELIPLLPKALYLGGGTAVAAHLGHRKSRDLDLFYHENAVDMAAFKQALLGTGEFALEAESAGTLMGYYRETKLEILHSDQGQIAQKLIEQPAVLSGMRVAGLSDLAAMKMSAMGGRGQLRDYFDLKLIEEQGGISVEDALAHYMTRYRVDRTHTSIRHIVDAMGYLDDVDEDKLVPAKKRDLERWWKARQVRLMRNLSY